MKYPKMPTFGAGVLFLLLVAGCDRGPAPIVSGKLDHPVNSAQPIVETLTQLGSAPVWNLRDLEGRPVSLADYRGKVVLLDFWATWCVPCREEIPRYIEWQKKYAGQGLVVIGVSFDRVGAAQVKRFAGEMNINYPIVLGDPKVGQAYGMEVLPTTYLIDRKGKVRHGKAGLFDSARYEALISQLLN